MSCHFTQYMPKRRHQKLKIENNTVTIGEYKIELEAEKKEKQLVDKLKDQLKVYQQAVEVEVKKEEEKETDKDKVKKAVQNGKKWFSVKNEFQDESKMLMWTHHMKTLSINFISIYDFSLCLWYE